MTVLQGSIALGMRGHLALAAAALLAVAAVPTLAQAPGSIPGVLAPSAAPELVQEGFVFTEGPVGTADGGLYFSDIRVSKVFYLDAGGKISMVRENTDGANGLALTRDGELCSLKVTASASPSATRTAPSQPSPKGRLACRSSRPTTCWWTPKAASISPTLARGRWCRADRPTCTTSHPARGRRSCSTAAWGDLTG